MGAVAVVVIRKCSLPQVAETAVEFTANGLFMGGCIREPRCLSPLPGPFLTWSPASHPPSVGFAIFAPGQASGSPLKTGSGPGDTAAAQSPADTWPNHGACEVGVLPGRREQQQVPAGGPFPPVQEQLLLSSLRCTDRPVLKESYCHYGQAGRPQRCPSPEPVQREVTRVLLLWGRETPWAHLVLHPDILHIEPVFSSCISFTQHLLSVSICQDLGEIW